LLKALAGAGGVFATGRSLPEQWVRPVVDSVLLPAHAQATIIKRDFAGPVTPESASGPGPSPMSKILDFLVPPAHATALPISTATLCVTVTGSAFDATLLLSNVNGCGIFTGNGTVNGGFANLTGSSSVFTNVKLQVPDVSVASLSYNLTFEQYGTDFNDSGSISTGACSISDSACIPGP
jgi:hypothetical protein